MPRKPVPSPAPGRNPAPLQPAEALARIREAYLEGEFGIRTHCFDRIRERGLSALLIPDLLARDGVGCAVGEWAAATKPSHEHPGEWRYRVTGDSDIGRVTIVFAIRPSGGVDVVTAYKA